MYDIVWYVITSSPREQVTVRHRAFYPMSHQQTRTRTARQCLDGVLIIFPSFDRSYVIRFPPEGSSPKQRSIDGGRK